MINVDLTIVGFFDEINHASLSVPGNRPTVKTALEAMRDRCFRRDDFDFDERRDVIVRAPYRFLSTEDNMIVSMKYRGFKLSTNTLQQSPFEQRAWKFTVLRRAGDRSVLMQNTKNLAFDQFRLEDGDQIFWCLITTLNRNAAMSIGLEDFEQDTLIAV